MSWVDHLRARQRTFIRCDTPPERGALLLYAMPSPDLIVVDGTFSNNVAFDAAPRAWLSDEAKGKDDEGKCPVPFDCHNASLCLLCLHTRVCHVLFL